MSASQWAEETHILMELDNVSPGPRSCNFWSDLSLPLPLPEAQVVALRNIACRMSNGCQDIPPGIIAVFTGCDAAGKLMAAEALAYEMQRPLYRVNMSEMDGLSSGEREKHFARVLHAARAESAILMLDNTDGLPNPFLETLKGYPGLSILTMDSIQERLTALHKSIHYIVDFPFPFDNE
jgi:hypothetical protein